MAGRTNPGSPRDGVPKSQRTTSPARISDIARRRIEHGFVGSIEWGACKLRTDDTTTLPSHQLCDLCVEGETLTISELAESVPSPDGHLDGSRFRHTPKYTNRRPVSRREALRSGLREVPVSGDVAVESELLMNAGFHRAPAAELSLTTGC